VSNTRKETCPHCDGCGYVEVPVAPERTEPRSPLSLKELDDGFSDFYLNYECGSRGFFVRKDRQKEVPGE
jgi:hypothetical protein